MENKKALYASIENLTKANLLLYAILENDEGIDLIEEPCRINIKKYDNFFKAIKILSDLKSKGKCDFEASDIRKEYVFHTIYINWNMTDEFWVCIDKTNKKEIKMLLDYMDECLIRDDEANIWQLSSKIYVPESEIKEGD